MKLAEMEEDSVPLRPHQKQVQAETSSNLQCTAPLHTHLAPLQDGPCPSREGHGAPCLSPMVPAQLLASLLFSVHSLQLRAYATRSLAHMRVQHFEYVISFMSRFKFFESLLSTDRICRLVASNDGHCGRR